MSEDKVPKWFSDFAIENEKAHGELNAKIESVKGSILAWTLSAIGVAVAVISGLMIYLD